VHDQADVLDSRNLGACIDQLSKFRIPVAGHDFEKVEQRSCPRSPVRPTEDVVRDGAKLLCRLEFTRVERLVMRIEGAGHPQRECQRERDESYDQLQFDSPTCRKESNLSRPAFREAAPAVESEAPARVGATFDGLKAANRITER